MPVTSFRFTSASEVRSGKLTRKGDFHACFGHDPWGLRRVSRRGGSQRRSGVSASRPRVRRRVRVERSGHVRGQPVRSVLRVDVVSLGQGQPRNSAVGDGVILSSLVSGPA